MTEQQPEQFTEKAEIVERALDTHADADLEIGEFIEDDGVGLEIDGFDQETDGDER